MALLEYEWAREEMKADRMVALAGALGLWDVFGIAENVKSQKPCTICLLRAVGPRMRDDVMYKGDVT